MGEPIADDCCFCGWPIEYGKNGLAHEDDEVRCPDCGAHHLVGVDDSDPEWPRAYLRAVTCGHGVAAEEPCPGCDGPTAGWVQDPGRAPPSVRGGP